MFNEKKSTAFTFILILSSLLVGAEKPVVGATWYPLFFEWLKRRNSLKTQQPSRTSNYGPKPKLKKKQKLALLGRLGCRTIGKGNK